MNQIRKIRIPPIKTSNKQFGFELDQFEIPLDDFLPSFIEYKLSKGIVMGIRDTITDQKYSSISIVLHELHLDISSVPFSYQVNSGITRLRDRGSLDFQTLKTGISLNLKLAYYPDDSLKTFQVEKADVFMDKIKFQIQNANHRVLYFLFRPAIKNLIRSHSTQSLKMKIREVVSKVDMIVTRRKVQQTARSNLAAKKVQKKLSSDIGKEKTKEKIASKPKSNRENYPWESDVFDLTYI